MLTSRVRHIDATGDESRCSFSQAYFPRLCRSEADHEKARNALTKADASDKSFKGVLKAALRRADKKIVQDAGESVVESAPEYLAPLINGASGRLARTFVGVFSSSAAEE